jgi:tRNA (guanine37-N1)-methyltransferase
MKYYVMTLFPEMIEQGMNTSIIGRAIEEGRIELNVRNIRDYTLDKHGKVDDYPYGGGAGMVMEAEPIYRCYETICSETGTRPRVIYLTPQGDVFRQELARDFSQENTLVFLCGHYEGVDERVLEEIVTDYVSIGDYVLTGGELPAMVMMDAIARMIPAVLHNADSAETESFSDGLLEYPQYTRPETALGRSVPPVLLSGHHEKIRQWRLEQSLERTKARRRDLYEAWLDGNDEK